MPTVNAKRLAIAIPTYNESKNIPRLIDAIRRALDKNPSIVCTILIIDDNSPDGTSKIAKELAKKNKSKNLQIRVMDRSKKEGLGKAYIDGFKLLLDEKKHDLILEMDADLSHDPKYITKFIKASETADLVVGSRYINGGCTPDWTLPRKILSRGGNIYTSLILGTKIHDYTGGYNLYSEKLLNKIDLNKLQASGYGFQIELKFNAMKYANKTTEIPITFIDRQHGSSKLPKSTILSILLLVPQIKLTAKKD